MDGDEDRGSDVMTVAVLFFVLAWLAVGLRVYSRAWLTRSFGIDDKATVLLLILFTPYLILQIMSIKNGQGQHRASLPVDTERRGLLYWYICRLFYVVCTCILKISVCLLLLRLTVVPLHVWALRFLMLSTMTGGLVYFCLGMFQCMPIQVFWNDSPFAVGRCIPTTAFFFLTITASIFNCIGDVALATLPCVLVWSIKLPRKTKVLVAGLLSLAAMCALPRLPSSIATLIRAAFIPNQLRADDFLYETTSTAVWSTVELGMGICAASMATLLPVFKLIRRKLGLVCSKPECRARDKKRQQAWALKRCAKDISSQDSRRRDVTRLQLDQTLGAFSTVTVTVSALRPSSPTARRLSRSGNCNTDSFLERSLAGKRTAEEASMPARGIQKTVEITVTRDDPDGC